MPRPTRHPADARGLFPGWDVPAEAVALGAAMERYRRRHGRPYPTFAEVLAVAKGLGWRKTAPATTEVT